MIIVLLKYSNTTLVKVKWVYQFMIMINWYYSNTTLVKVKSWATFTRDKKYLIQIQHLLKLNKTRTALEIIKNKNSNTTLVKVKYFYWLESQS